jgi:hypothetical protein
MFNVPVETNLLYQKINNMLFTKITQFYDENNLTQVYNLVVENNTFYTTQVGLVHA